MYIIFYLYNLYYYFINYKIWLELLYIGDGVKEVNLKK